MTANGIATPQARAQASGRPVPPEWVDAAKAHMDAVAQFAAEARRFPATHWQEPLAKGKWSAAQVTAHLIDAYGVVRGQLAGGPGMRFMAPAPWRWLLRNLVLPQLLRGVRFPPGIRAPVETLPVTVLPDAATAIAMLEDVVGRLMTEMVERHAAGPVRISHAYFGSLEALQAIRLSTVHTRHHARQLARASS